MGVPRCRSLVRHEIAENSRSDSHFSIRGCWGWIRRNNLVAALIKGFPPDLDWYEGQAPRGDWLFVGTSANELHLFGAEEIERKLKRLENPEDLLMNLTPKKGMKF
jgi:hypothetical protein